MWAKKTKNFPKQGGRYAPRAPHIGTPLSVRDTLLIGMKEQRIENANKKDDEPRQVVRLKKPNEKLGFIYEQIPTFDIEYAKEFG